MSASTNLAWGDLAWEEALRHQEDRHDSFNSWRYHINAAEINHPPPPQEPPANHHLNDSGLGLDPVPLLRPELRSKSEKRQREVAHYPSIVVCRCVVFAIVVGVVAVVVAVGTVSVSSKEQDPEDWTLNASLVSSRALTSRFCHSVKWSPATKTSLRIIHLLVVDLTCSELNVDSVESFIM